MALCLECNADYIRGITVCPACNRPLEPDRDPEPEPAASADFVPLLNLPYAEGLAAAASLEAAGLETRSDTTTNYLAFVGMPFHVTILVRERDLDVARTALRIR